MITREEVRWGYIYLLGREPENEQVYDDYCRFRDIHSFRKCLIYSDEGSRGLLAQARDAIQQPEIDFSSPSLVFIHIEKTGGTTLHAALAQSFHPDRVTEPHFQYPQRCTISELGRFSFLSGHFSYQEALCLPHFNKMMVSLFRNPYERLISYYRFHRAHSRDLSDNPHVDLAHAFSAEDFFQHPEVKSSRRLNNVYLRTFLSPSENEDFDLSIFDPTLLDSVLRRIDTLQVAGITEDMESTLRLIEHQFGVGSAAELATYHRTEGLHLVDASFQGVEHIPLTQELIGAMAPHVIYDESIYRHVCAAFHDRLGAIDRERACRTDLTSPDRAHPARCTAEVHRLS